MTKLLENQVSFFIWSFISGCFIAFFYDMLRVQRKVFKISDFLVILTDILFLLVSGLVIFFIAYFKNNSEMRFFEFIGVFLGILVYILIFKNRFLDFSVRISNMFIKVFVRIIKTISYPVCLVFKIIKKPFVLVAWYVTKTIKKTKFVINLRNNVLFSYFKNMRKKIQKQI